jgi:lysophospholipase L1-like esterase
MLKKHILLGAEQYADNSYVRNGRAVDKTLKAVADRNGVAFFSVIDALCVSDRCLATTTLGGKPTLTFWDTGHLTEGGSMLLAAELAQKLK